MINFFFVNCTYSFSQLKGSSDDGTATLTLNFQDPSGSNNLIEQVSFLVFSKAGNSLGFSTSRSTFYIKMVLYKYYLKSRNRMSFWSNILTSFCHVEHKMKWVHTFRPKQSYGFSTKVFGVFWSGLFIYTQLVFEIGSTL